VEKEGGESRRCIRRGVRETIGINMGSGEKRKGKVQNEECEEKDQRVLFTN
jgi:hypothetical protein